MSINASAVSWSKVFFGGGAFIYEVQTGVTDVWRLFDEATRSPTVTLGIYFTVCIMIGSAVTVWSGIRGLIRDFRDGMQSKDGE